MKLILAICLTWVASIQAQSVPPPGDCKWELNSLLETSPLFIKTSGGINGQFGINDFWLPQSEVEVTVPVGIGVIFACPGGTLIGPGGTEATLTCTNVFLWEAANGSTYLFNELQCSKVPVSVAIENPAKSCNNKITENTKMIDIGFKLQNGNFYVLIESCFNSVDLDTLYTKNIQVPAIGGKQSNIPRPRDVWVQGDFYGSVVVNNKYTCSNYTKEYERVLGNTDQVNNYFTCGTQKQLTRGHLTARVDLVYESQRGVTFWFLNAAPQWATPNGRNWDKLEQSTRDYASKYPRNLHVYSGTHGNALLPDHMGTLTPIHIYYEGGNNIAKLRVPNFYWRVVYDPVTSKGTAFIVMNNPYEATPPMLGTDVCDQITWVVWDANNQEAGYAHCYEVDVLARTVGEIPNLVVNGLLL